MHRNVLKYTFKVWLTSLLIAPAISTAVFIARARIVALTLAGILLSYLLQAIVAAILSIVSWFVLSLLTDYLLRAKIKLIWLKLLLSIAGIILAIAPLLFIIKDRSDSVDTACWVAYPGTILVGIWFYKLKNPYADAEPAVSRLSA